ncbi:protein FAR-RED ELONGATED HYPOCOTYL 3 isoform X2 [Hevea brasiliensis]|uniref:protein FAR-RED ELONGATED HYPOCOTYL 3 isoform X2 n=1 Tax=Hevea brasiliensis TaxID=3981 RepID=UPI0025D1C80F|nr:protein FAR-RED ELONGATED HYPOCOTYL 3 isoform X2 [Hevea brasiliensis]
MFHHVSLAVLICALSKQESQLSQQLPFSSLPEKIPFPQFSPQKITEEACFFSLMDTRMDDADGRLEISRGGEPSPHEIDKNQEPYEGMLFESEERAKAFYDDYARHVGFSTRVLSSRKSERDGSLISRGIGCRGGSDGRRRGKSHMQDKQQEGCKAKQQEGCKAMILLKREKPGRWIVRKFLGAHNHPFVDQLPKSRQKLELTDKKAVRVAFRISQLQQ